MTYRQMARPAAGRRRLPRAAPRGVKVIMRQPMVQLPPGADMLLRLMVVTVAIIGLCVLTWFVLGMIERVGWMTR